MSCLPITKVPLWNCQTFLSVYRKSSLKPPGAAYFFQTHLRGGWGGGSFERESLFNLAKKMMGLNGDLRYTCDVTSAIALFCLATSLLTSSSWRRVMFSESFSSFILWMYTVSRHLVNPPSEGPGRNGKKLHFSSLSTSLQLMFTSIQAKSAAAQLTTFRSFETINIEVFSVLTFFLFINGFFA